MGRADSSTSQLVQTMAAFGGGNGAAESLNAAALGADTSQQTFLTAARMRRALCSSSSLPPSPPAEKATASENHPGARSRQLLRRHIPLGCSQLYDTRLADDQDEQHEDLSSRGTLRKSSSPAVALLKPGFLLVTVVIRPPRRVYEMMLLVSRRLGERFAGPTQP